MKANTTMSLRIPSGILEAIQAARGDASTSAWIRRAILQRLEREAEDGKK